MDNISSVISGNDLLNLSSRVESYNKALNPSRAAKNFLDKNDFLKILLTQLTHQDPTQPMEDKEFVAQMAQFSSLEQMSNMNTEIGRILSLMAKSQAVALLGRTVEILEGNKSIEGTVDEVSGDEYPQILVNGVFYDASHVISVRKE